MGLQIIRVISGKARGMSLKTVPGKNTRPTSDKVKEALFSILMPYIKCARILELYAGTGSLSIEALSRGAESAVLVERNRTALVVIEQNLEKTGFTADSTILAMDVFYALNKLSQSGEKFDIIFIDPPYGMGLAGKTARMALESGVLTNDGIMIAEHDGNDGSEDDNTGRDPYRIKKYGRTVLAFYSGEDISPGNGVDL